MAFTDTVNTSKRFKLGTRRKVDNKDFIYLQGIASTAVGSWVNIDTLETGVTALLDTDVAATVLGRVAVAMAAIGASQFGWYQIYGPASGLALTASTDAKNAFATSTGGSVDDSGAGAEVMVFGAWSVDAVNETTFLQDFMLNYPYMIGVSLD
jgi:hypothetical protein